MDTQLGLLFSLDKQLNFQACLVSVVCYPLILVTWCTLARVLSCIQFIYIGYNEVFMFMIIVFITKKDI
jgi:hypothetical protein